jgi:very-short-patch-repair endonuclease/predicted transcriptional regulator of viral defense system
MSDLPPGVPHICQPGVDKAHEPHLDSLIAELAARQHGLVVLAQLLALGLSRQAVARRVKAGRLHRVYRGVYAVGHRRLTRHGRWMAAVLAYGCDALLSHLSALALRDLRPDNRALVDVTVPRGTVRSRKGIQVHSSIALVVADRSVVDGIPCTSLARSLLDSAPALGVKGIEKVIERAEILRVFDLREFDELLDRAAGHHGAGLVEAVLRDLAEPDWTESDYEAAVLALVRASGLGEPICQAPMVLGGEPVRIDFLWPVERVVLEADSYEFHGTRAAFERDRRRDQLLRLAGYEPLRITWRQLTRHPEQVEELLRDRLAAGRAMAA